MFPFMLAFCLYLKTVTVGCWNLQLDWINLNMQRLECCVFVWIGLLMAKNHIAFLRACYDAVQCGWRVLAFWRRILHSTLKMQAPRIYLRTHTTSLTRRKQSSFFVNV